MTSADASAISAVGSAPKVPLLNANLRRSKRPSAISAVDFPHCESHAHTRTRRTVNPRSRALMALPIAEIPPDLRKCTVPLMALLMALP